MGSLTKYKSKELCTVKIKTVAPDEDGGADTDFVYAFYTNIPDASRTKLGIVTLAPGTELPNGAVMACSYPKPARASKRFTDRSTSSFVADSAIPGAKLDDWTVTRTRKLPKIHLGNNTNSLVRTVYVKVNGIKYAWNCPKTSLEKITDAVLTTLGIKYATADDLTELCFGATYPKPPKAKKQLGATADDLSVVSTFYDPDKPLPAGWQIVDSGFLTYVA